LTIVLKTARSLGLALAAALLALLWAELGLRGAAGLWKLAYRGFCRPASFPVYVVGESTAFGEPFAPRITFPRIMSLMLGGRLRGKPIEIVPLAQPGSNTEAQYWRLWRELALRPRPQGILLVYAGVNEAYAETSPSRWALWADQSLILSRLGALLRGRRGPRLGLDYEHRLDRLIALARSYGYPVVVSTLVGNVRDFQPDVSAALRQDPARWADYERARRLEGLGRWQAAAGLYAALAAGADAGPGVLHRQARCLLALGRAAQAKALFWQAIDQGRTERPTTAQDEAVRRAVLRGGAALSDTRAIFEAASPQGLPGGELFMDAHHPSLRGYILLAQGFARQVSRLLDSPLPRPELSEAEIKKELGFLPIDEHNVAVTRFLWFCAEARLRADNEESLLAAQRYLRLAEQGPGASHSDADDGKIRNWQAELTTDSGMRIVWRGTIAGGKVSGVTIKTDAQGRTRSFKW
jgi:hypothetical protein